MNVLETAINRSDAKSSLAMQRALELKRVGGLPLVPSTEQSIWADSASARRSRVRYSQFRGWLYGAIHAIAREGAAQPVRVGRLVGASYLSLEEENTSRFRTKGYITRKIPKAIQEKGVNREWEIIEDHPILDMLERPNPMQGRWEFVYSFIVNLCLTGWSYVVWDSTKDGKMVVYSLPTSWVTPKHDKGPFSSFVIGNPDDPDPTKRVVLGPDKVALARMPDPSNPIGAFAPADSQQPAIRVDEHIQASQEVFFENGVFPSVIVQIGKDPHPDVPGGLRPRLSGPQRRQIVSAIKSTMAGIANYGNPAIVDGMIESIEKLSMTQNELGWEKSEDKIRARILSTFGVHPFILGEIVNVGGYAQAREIKERFFGVVNSYLDMLSNVMSRLAEAWQDTRGRLYVWWEMLEAKDPMLESINLREARKLGDISPDEFRAELGYPPRDPEAEKRSALLDTPLGMQAIAGLLAQVGMNQISRESAAHVIAKFLQISYEDALEMVIMPEKRPVLPPPFGIPQKPEEEEDEDEDEEEDEEEESEEEEMKDVRELIRLLELNPEEIAAKVLCSVHGNDKSG